MTIADPIYGPHGKTPLTDPTEGRTHKTLDTQFILELLKDLGPVTVTVKDRLDHVSDEAELTRLFKVAAKATSIQEFEKELH